MKTAQVLIIGSGPAGYTAAIYTSRAMLAPIMFTGIQAGGQLTTTTEVENFPGYPKGTDGPSMMEDFRNQAEQFGTTIVYESIIKVDFHTKTKMHHVWTDSGAEYQAPAIIISTGAGAKYLGLESEQRLLNKGVSACAVCDGFFYKGKEVAIVGGGDTACEEALYLANLCPQVHMFVRRDVLRASQILQERVAKTNNIIMHWNTEIQEVLGDTEVTGLRLHNNTTNTSSELKIDGLFVAIGHEPNTDIFKDILKLDHQGYIINKPDSSHTGIAGVFACGDVSDKVYRQAITAAGAGCKAALDAERYISAL